MGYNTAAIRKLLIAAFDDEDFGPFCSDYYHDVYEQFALGMTMSQKVQLLLDYCADLPDGLDDLLQQVKSGNPDKYAELEPGLRAPDESAVKIHQAYVVQSSLLHFESFLFHPEQLLPPFAFLAAGDALYLERTDREEAISARRSLHRCSSTPGPSGRFIKGIGPISHRAYSFDVPEDDPGEEFPPEFWMIPGVEAPCSNLGHVPYLVDANWSFRLLNRPADMPPFHLRPHLYLHLFPYGVVNMLFCTELFCKKGLEVTQLVHLLQGLSHVERSWRPLTFELTRAAAHEQVSTREIFSRAAEELDRRLFISSQKPYHLEDRLHAPMSTVVLLGNVQPKLDPRKHAREMSGLVTGEADWQTNRPEYAKPYGGSDYGKRTGDWIKFGKRNPIVYVPIFGGEGTRSYRHARRLFFWNLSSRVELARCEAFLYRYYADYMGQVWQRWVKDRSVLLDWLNRQVSLQEGYVEELRPLFFWEDLLSFADRQAYHSKVYRIAAEKAEVPQLRARFETEMKRFMDFALAEEPRAVAAVKRLLPVVSKIL